jgi:F-type H+-transporting ATPase subunit epsilon
LAGRTLSLRVITPERIVLDARVSSVRLPGVDGSIGVLPRHAHMVAAIDVGLLHYTQDGIEHVLFVSEGFAEVKDDTLRVVCEAGERPAEIDEERARAAEARARERLTRFRGAEAIPEPVDLLRAEAALRRALTRLEALKYAPRERVRT